MNRGGMIYSYRILEIENPQLIVIGKFDAFACCIRLMPSLHAVGVVGLACNLFGLVLFHGIYLPHSVESF
jgi:hypothetical protein